MSTTPNSCKKKRRYKKQYPKKNILKKNSQCGQTENVKLKALAADYSLLGHEKTGVLADIIRETHKKLDMFEQKRIGVIAECIKNNIKKITKKYRKAVFASGNSAEKITGSGAGRRLFSGRNNGGVRRDFEREFKARKRRTGKESSFLKKQKKGRKGWGSRGRGGSRLGRQVFPRHFIIPSLPGLFSVFYKK